MRKLLLIGLTLLVCSCGEQTQERNKLQKIDWLLGYWKYTSDGGTVTEAWLQADENSYSGEGKFLDTAGKVLSTEHIEILLKDDQLYYVPTVSNQNGGKPIEFKETLFNDTAVVFENLEHDFPQRIAYQKTSDTSILAYVEGIIDSQNNRMEFYYSK